MTPLSAPQARVVGSLVEKQLTTPQQYPLTANALVLACNQASNRDPVVAYTGGEVAATLDELRDRRLVRFVLPSHGRSVVRYRHVLDEALGLDATQLAVLAVLLLRGPQTVGELRGRSGRMASLESLGAVEHELDLLAGHEPPLVARIARRPGQKEDRWCELLSGGSAAEAESGAGAGASPVSVPSWPPAPAPAPAPTPVQVPVQVPAAAPAADAASGDVAMLREEVAALREEIVAVRAALEELRTSLGG